MISVYCDGSNDGKTGTPGGFGWVIIKDGQFMLAGYGGEKKTTNNRQELKAAIEGLSAVIKHGINDKVELISDSKYVLNLAIRNWKASKNLDLVEDLQGLADKLKITTKWVRGHSGNLWNEECDRLANLGKNEAR